jgi:hypothetical protein
MACDSVSCGFKAVPFWAFAARAPARLRSTAIPRAIRLNHVERFEGPIFARIIMLASEWISFR